MTTATIDTVAILKAAAQVLAGLDPDRAAYANGVGYSAADGTFGHSLSLLPIERWTPEITAAAWQMLRIYKVQLAGAGIDFDAIPKPVEEGSSYGREEANLLTRKERQAAEVARKIAEESSLRVDGSLLRMEFPYDDTLVSEARKLPGRRWDGTANTYPLKSAHAVVIWAKSKGINIDPAAEALASQPVPEPPPGVCVENGKLAIRFEFDADVVGAVRGIPGAKYVPEPEPMWVAPYTAVAARAAVEFATARKLTIDPTIAAQVEEMERHAAELADASYATDADIEVPGMAAGFNLFGYQRGGVAYARRVRRCIIADEMGLGKSLQASATVILENAFPCVLVVPNTLLMNWGREIEKFFVGRSFQVVRGTKREAIPTGIDFTVINYDIVGDRVDDLIALAPQALIVDESHYIKNKGTKKKPVQRTAAVLKLAKAIPQEGLVLLLSGTPVTNRPKELVSQLEAIGKIDDFGGSWKFMRRYCGAHQDKFGNWDTNGASNLPELHQHLRETCYVRRLKAEIMSQLPARRHAPVVLEVPPAKMAAYRKAEADVVEYLAQRARALALEAGEDATAAYWQKKLRAEAAKHLVTVGALLRAAVEAKLEAAYAWIDDFLAVDEERKLIIFAENIDIVETLASRYKTTMGAVKVRGGVKMEDRMAAVDRFQTDPGCRVFVGNIDAAREGLTLTAASDVVFVQLAWTPAEHDQAIDRCYGRVNDPHGATGWYLLAPETIEEKVMGLLANKRVVVDGVTDGKVTAGANHSVLSDLIVGLAGEGMSS